MVANRRRDTKPELAVRRLLHAHGFRFRVDHRPSASVRTRADVVFTRVRIAIFIDGCFWHQCPTHFVMPKSNIDYWKPKITRNVTRDVETTGVLLDQGWTVLRYWEHTPPSEVARDIERTYRRFVAV